MSLRTSFNNDVIYVCASFCCRLFPPISSDATRNEYKRIFNEEYQEYLELKGQIDVVTNEVTALNEQMAAVKKGTEEAKV